MAFPVNTTRPLTYDFSANRTPGAAHVTDALAGFFIDMVPPGARFRDKPQTVFFGRRGGASNLPASGPLLADDESVSPTEEDFGWPVLPQLSAVQLSHSQPWNLAAGDRRLGTLTPPATQSKEAGGRGIRA
jgi:hypothetical protein